MASNNTNGISQENWNKVLTQAAVRATKAKMEANKKILGKEQDTKDADKYFDEYLRRLRNAYPFDSIKETDLASIDQYSGDSTRKWLDRVRGVPSPTEYTVQAEAAKILPLLNGVAEEGADWYSMGSGALKEAGADMGYNVRSKEGFKAFLDKLAETQQMHDRAQLLKEYQSQGADYWLPKLFYPSATQEIENAIATGQGLDAAAASNSALSDPTLRKLMAADYVANNAMALAPGLTIGKINPVYMGLIDAGIQGGLEAGRQGIKAGVSETGQEFDASAPLASTALGATRPGMTLVGAGFANQIPGEGARSFGRGFTRAARTGNPFAAEEQEIKKAVNAWNQLQKDERLAVRGIAGTQANDVKPAKYVLTKNDLSDAVVDRIEDDVAQRGSELAQVPALQTSVFDGAPVIVLGEDEARAALASRVPEYMKAFVDKNGKSLVKVNPDGTVSAKQILDLYNRPTVKFAVRDRTTGKLIDSEPIFSGGSYGFNAPENQNVLGGKAKALFAQLFPEKYSELNVAKGPYNAGRVAGSLAAETGSRVEPIIRTNPLNLDKEEVRKSFTDYKDEPWYRKLDKESRKIIDDAFKKKEEEE